MSSDSRKPPLLIYDGQCPFCIFSKEWIERWDTKRRIQFLSFHEVEGFAQGEKGGSDRITAMQFVDCSGTVSSGVTAFREMLRFLPWGSLLAVLFRLPGILGFAEWVYPKIARNRYRIRFTKHRQASKANHA